MYLLFGGRGGLTERDTPSYLLVIVFGMVTVCCGHELPGRLGDSRSEWREVKHGQLDSEINGERVQA